MAIAVEVVAIGIATAATSATAGPVTPAGSNRHLIGFGAHSAGTLANYTDMTWGGAAMTPKINATNPNYERIVAEEQAAPAASSGSLVYTVAATQDEMACAVIAFSGVDASTPTDTYQQTGADTADPISISVTVPAGDLGVGWCYTISSTIASGQTQQAESEGIGGGTCANLATVVGSASAMTWTRTGIGTNDWIAIAVNLNAAVVTATPSRRGKPTIHPGNHPGPFGARLRTKRNNTVAVTTVTGTVAYTNAADTLAAAGSPTVSGVVAQTNANDSIDARGAPATPVGSRRLKSPVHPGAGPYNLQKFKKSRRNTSQPTLTGSLAVSNANDTLSAAGAPTVSGSLAKANADDTSAAAGAPTVNGSLAQTNAADTLAASGSPTVTGSVAYTNANDTLAASGSTGGGTTGTVNYTNADDTLSAAGNVAISGSVGYTNVDDAISAAGTAGNPSTGGGAVIVDTPKKKRGRPRKAIPAPIPQPVEPAIEASRVISEEEAQGMEAIYGAQMRPMVEPTKPAEPEAEAFVESVIEPFDVPASVFGAGPTTESVDSEAPPADEVIEEEDDIALIMAIIEAIG